MDLFEYDLDEMIEGPELGGSATYMEVACNSDINLFI
jgi:peroxiredoxin family protein